MLDLMYSASSLEKQLNDGCCFVVVYDGDEAVGFASYQHLSDGEYKLHKLYILLSQQGKGTGRFVIEYICDAIKSKSAKTLQLQVNRYNTAKSFYSKLGFIIIAEKKSDIGNGYVMDDYIMEKKIGE